MHLCGVICYNCGNFDYLYHTSTFTLIRLPTTQAKYCNIDSKSRCKYQCFLRVFLLNLGPLPLEPPAQEHLHFIETLGEEEEQPPVQRKW